MLCASAVPKGKKTRGLLKQTGSNVILCSSSRPKQRTDVYNVSEVIIELELSINLYYEIFELIVISLFKYEFFFIEVIVLKSIIKTFSNVIISC